MTLPASPKWWKKAQTALTAADPVIGRIVHAYRGDILFSKGDPFFTLARSIVGQQISIKAADTVWQRLLGALNAMMPETMLTANEDILRACGLSRSKVVYLKSLAEHFLSHPEKRWTRKSDETIIAELTQIKGVGRWTAEMFLIFHMTRPDVLPLADIGLRKAVEKHYNRGRKMTPGQIEEIAEPWRPWRSAATWYLWRSLDPVPVEY